MKKGTQNLQTQWTNSELLDLVISKPLYFTPGSNWHYSNTNYILASLIIEKITNHRFEDELHTRLLNRIPLNRTYYLPTLYSDDFIANMAHGYSEVGLFPEEPKDITWTNNSWASAAGAMVANTQDIALWFYHVVHGTFLAPQQQAELMTTIDATFPPLGKIGYGLGIMHDSHTFKEEAWWHSGATLGYNSIMLWLKNRDIIITVTINSITPTRDVYELARDITAVLQ